MIIQRHIFGLVMALALAAPAARGDVVVETHAYGSEDAQALDLYSPSPGTGEALPVIVLAHGGLWEGGSRRSLEDLCRNLVERSGERLACASIDYRLSQAVGGVCEGSGVPAYREQAADFARAYAFLQENASTLGLAADRMFIGGHSAGAHLAQILNLRWNEFAAACTAVATCSPALGAIGIEGIYDIPAWNIYDAQFWGGRFACATRKAFGAPGPEPAACVEDRFAARCWDAGSPVYLAEQAGLPGVAPRGDALLVQSPGDDWVDGSDTVRLGEALAAAFPGAVVETDVSGRCGSLGHNEILGETALADCIVEFVDATVRNEAGRFRINAGLSDAWYEPKTSGQGFFVTVWEDSATMFLGWFTYDAERPPADVTAQLGEPGHRWFTAQGAWAGDAAELDLYVTAGGVFDAAEPAAAQPERVGRVLIRFSDCENGVVSYRLTAENRSGEIPIRRIVPDNVALCEALSATPGDAAGR